jgi:hypothetical protein
MMAVLKAGATYFAIVYVVGFLLGTMRVFLLVPRVGETVAVLLEAPVILGASWIVSRWSVSRFAVQTAAAPRFAMGGIAFGLLIVAETALSILVVGTSWMKLLEVYRSVPGIIGLAAQAVFGLLPFVQALLENRRHPNRTDPFP